MAVQMTTFSPECLFVWQNVLLQDEAEDTVQQLHLHDLSAAQDMLYLFKLPSALPCVAPASRPDNDEKGHRRGKQQQQQQQQQQATAAAAGLANKPAHLRQLPSGQLGKLLIFQSGKVKLQIGDILFDVTAGLPCVARQDAVALNSHGKALVQLGPVTQRAVVCPDVWQLMSDADVPSFPRAPGVGKRDPAAGLDGAAADFMAGVMGPIDDDGMDVEVEGEVAEAAAAAAATVGAGRPDVENGNGFGVDEEDTSSAEEGSASEEGSSERDSGQPSPQPGQEQQQEQQQQQQQVQAALDPLMGVLGLPSARAAGAAGAGRGRGRFKPSATRAAAGIRRGDAMDTNL